MPTPATPPVPWAVPPPALRDRSGLPALLSAPPSGIECSVPVRLLAFGPSPPCAAATTASADFCPSITMALGVISLAADEQISRGKTRDLRPIDSPHMRPLGPGATGLRVFWPSRPPNGRLLCGSFSSDQGFAYSFLPTLPRDSAVAVRPEVPATKAPRGGPPCLLENSISKIKIVQSKTPSKSSRDDVTRGSSLRSISARDNILVRFSIAFASRSTVCSSCEKGGDGRARGARKHFQMRANRFEPKNLESAPSSTKQAFAP